MYVIKENGKTYDCKYPHHWVKGNELLLHKGGLDAAWAASQGARSGQKASPEIISHLEAHRKALGVDKEKTKKEVKSMNIQELKETHPDLVKAIADEAVTLVSGEVEGLKAKVTELGAENKKLTLELAVRDEQTISMQAEGIKKSILADSGIPESLHGKVAGMVDFHPHAKEGKLDVEAFTAAFTAEAKDWEEKLKPVASARGVIDPKKDKSDVPGADMETINKVLNM